jgi:CRP/FNR family cyclic AMP-dependent transcriptional regulator
MMSPTRPKASPSKGSGKLRKAISKLYGTDIFKGIEPTELGMFFDNVELQTCPAGTILFMPEDSCERLYILRQGRVDIYRLTSSGKRLVTRRIQAGSVFGMMGLLGQTMQGNFAEATEDSTVCMITREDVLALLKRQPDVALRVLEIVGNRLRRLEERLVEAAYSPVSMRLAHFLLTNVDLASGVLTNVTHEEIGDTIGAVRQTVTEALSRMRNQGLILTAPKQIRVIDRHRLESIVHGSDI